MPTNQVLAKLAIEISANTTQLGKGVNAAVSSLKNLESSLQTTQRILGAFGIGLGAYQIVRGLQEAIGILAGFEKQMSEVKAITGATGDQFAALEKSAKDLGASTKFTAREVAQLQVAYGRLGFNTDEILNATKATLDLAAATGEDLAGSADVAGSTLRGFELDASETTRVVDVMASSFNKSALSLENFRESMKYVAPVANAAGASIEETTAYLAVLADAGIRGSQAGTSLRRIFTDMTKDGRPLEERLQELGKRGITLSDSFDEVGRTAQTALLVLSKNTDKAKDLSLAFNSADGEANKMARTMEDNLIGDVTKLTSAFEGLIITLGDSTLLRQFTQSLTSFVQSLSGATSGQDRLRSIAGELSTTFGTTEGIIKKLVDELIEFRRKAGEPLQFDLDSIREEYELTTEDVGRLQEIIDQVNGSLSKQELKLKAFKDFSVGYDDLSEAAEDFKQKQYDLIFAAQIQRAENDRLFSAIKESIPIRDEENKKLDQEIAYRRELIDFIVDYSSKLKQETADLKDSTGARVGIIQALEDEIKLKRQALNSATSLSELRSIALELDNLEKRLKILKNLSNPDAPTPVKINFDLDLSKISDFELDLKEFFRRYSNFEINAVPKFVVTKELEKQLIEFSRTVTDKLTKYMAEAKASISLDVEYPDQEQEEEYKRRFEKTATDIENRAIEMSNVISSGFSTLGQALGQAISGSEKATDLIIKTLAGFAQQMGEILIASGVAGLALQKLIINPALAIAAGTALVAIGAAASAAVQKSHQSLVTGGSGSSDGGFRSPTAYNPKFQDSLKVDVTVEGYIRGKDIWITNKEYERDNGYRRSG